MKGAATLANFRARRTLLAAAVLLFAAGCANRPASLAAAPADAISADVRVAACRDALAAGRSHDAPGLDVTGIRVLNWNVQKRDGSEWRRDFERLATDADLVLFQEASLAGHTGAGLVNGRHVTFAPGYRTSRRVTGLLTLSRSEPLVACSFATREPWLGTPKSTSVTAYALAGVDDLLAVVNIHAVNFALGMADYRGQLGRVAEVLRDHPGPIILAGDFNTWRGARLDLVGALARELRLRPVSFTDDERVRWFGFALDHIYVRDLELRRSGTDRVTTSDHNPMTAVLAMPSGAR